VPGKACSEIEQTAIFDREAAKVITQARAAHPNITLNGRDYYNALAPYFLNLAYTDNCDGEKADDLHIQLADRDRRFINDWMPTVGVFFDISIVAERWFAPFAPALSLPCGRFWLDTVEFDLPAHTVSIKASSLPVGIRIKAVNETRGWDDHTLQQIAQQISSENKMSAPMWETSINPRYDHIEQTEESSLAFLKKRANDAKLAIKVKNNQLIFFDEQDYEAKPATFTLVYGNVTGNGGLPVYRMTGGKFHINLVDALQKATVKSTDIESGKVNQGAYKTTDLIPPGYAPDSPNAPQNAPDLPPVTGDTGTTAPPLPSNTVDVSGLEDNVNDNPGDDSEDDESAGGGGGSRSPRDDPSSGGLAMWNPPGGGGNMTRKAKAHLRNRNKDSRHAEVDMEIGNPLIAAGTTCNLKGVGQYDGKWFVETAHHTVGPEYNTKLTIRRCLTGY